MGAEDKAFFFAEDEAFKIPKQLLFFQNFCLKISDFQLFWNVIFFHCRCDFVDKDEKLRLF